VVSPTKIGLLKLSFKNNDMQFGMLIEISLSGYAELNLKEYGKWGNTY
jgi:hypothetical protein